MILSFSGLELLQLLLSCSLLTLIIVIQVVHYPSFLFYDEITFDKAMVSHQARITWVVVPLMVTELLLSGWIALTRQTHLDLLIFGIVIAIWLVTFTLMVPLHSQLTLKKCDLTIKRLVFGNYARTLLWFLKFLLVLKGSRVL